MYTLCETRLWQRGPHLSPHLNPTQCLSLFGRSNVCRILRPPRPLAVSEEVYIFRTPEKAVVDEPNISSLPKGRPSGIASQIATPQILLQAGTEFKVQGIHKVSRFRKDIGCGVCLPRLWADAGQAVSAHRIYSLTSLRKSTLPQNRRPIVYYY